MIPDSMVVPDCHCQIPSCINEAKARPPVIFLLVLVFMMGLNQSWIVLWMSSLPKSPWRIWWSACMHNLAWSRVATNGSTRTLHSYWSLFLGQDMSTPLKSKSAMRSKGGLGSDPKYKMQRMDAIGPSDLTMHRGQHTTKLAWGLAALPTMCNWKLRPMLKPIRFSNAHLSVSIAYKSTSIVQTFFLLGGGLLVVDIRHVLDDPLHQTGTHHGQCKTHVPRRTQVKTVKSHLCWHLTRGPKSSRDSRNNGECV